MPSPPHERSPGHPSYFVAPASNFLKENSFGPWKSVRLRLVHISRFAWYETFVQLYWFRCNNSWVIVYKRNPVLKSHRTNQSTQLGWGGGLRPSAPASQLPFWKFLAHDAQIFKGIQNCLWRHILPRKLASKLLCIRGFRRESKAEFAF